MATSAATYSKAWLELAPRTVSFKILYSAVWSQELTLLELHSICQKIEGLLAVECIRMHMLYTLVYPQFTQNIWDAFTVY